MFTNKNFTKGEKDNIFENNTAVYGDTYSSFPSNLRFDFEPSRNV